MDGRSKGMDPKTIAGEKISEVFEMLKLFFFFNQCYVVTYRSIRSSFKTIVTSDKTKVYLRNEPTVLQIFMINFAYL
jgi:hypothetical protein